MENSEKKVMKRWKMLCIDAILTALLIFIDQFSKHLAIVYLKDKPAIKLIDGVLELQYLENRGSAFGMLQNQKFFILFVGIVCMAVVLFFLFKLPNQKKFRIVHVLIALIVSGGIGNMIDRLALGYVVDFIDFALIDFAVFNIADSFVCVGAGILILSLVLDIVSETKLAKASKDNKK